MFISRSPNTCYLAIIIFHSRIHRLWPLKILENDKLSIIKAIQDIRPQGSTAMAEALQSGLDQMDEVPASYTKRGYLLTDGMPDSDPCAVAEELKQKGMQLHTIGFGDGHEIDEGLLREMASTSSAGIPLYYHFMEAKNLTGFMKRQTCTITA